MQRSGVLPSSDLQASGTGHPSDPPDLVGAGHSVSVGHPFRSWGGAIRFWPCHDDFRECIHSVFCLSIVCSRMFVNHVFVNILSCVKLLCLIVCVPRTGYLRSQDYEFAHLREVVMFFLEVHKTLGAACDDRRFSWLQHIWQWACFGVYEV